MDTRLQAREQKILRLSEAFGGEGDIEVVVTMLNINYGKNRELMEACEPLSEYAWLVETIRENQRTMRNLEAAIDSAIDEMPDEFVIKRFLFCTRACTALGAIEASPLNALKLS